MVAAPPSTHGHDPFGSLAASSMRNGTMAHDRGVQQIFEDGFLAPGVSLEAIKRRAQLAANYAVIDELYAALDRFPNVLLSQDPVFLRERKEAQRKLAAIERFLHAETKYLRQQRERHAERERVIADCLARIATILEDWRRERASTAAFFAASEADCEQALASLERTQTMHTRQWTTSRAGFRRVLELLSDTPSTPCATEFAPSGEGHIDPSYDPFRAGHAYAGSSSPRSRPRLSLAIPSGVSATGLGSHGCSPSASLAPLSPTPAGQTGSASPTLRTWSSPEIYRVHSRSPSPLSPPRSSYSTLKESHRTTSHRPPIPYYVDPSSFDADSSPRSHHEQRSASIQQDEADKSFEGARLLEDYNIGRAQGKSHEELIADKSFDEKIGLQRAAFRKLSTSRAGSPLTAVPPSLVSSPLVSSPLLSGHLFPIRTPPPLSFFDSPLSATSSTGRSGIRPLRLHSRANSVASSASSRSSNPGSPSPNSTSTRIPVSSSPVPTLSPPPPPRFRTAMSSSSDSALSPTDPLSGGTSAETPNRGTLGVHQPADVDATPRPSAKQRQRRSIVSYFSSDGEHSPSPSPTALLFSTDAKAGVGSPLSLALPRDSSNDATLRPSTLAAWSEAVRQAQASTDVFEAAASSSASTLSEDDSSTTGVASQEGKDAGRVDEVHSSTPLPSPLALVPLLAAPVAVAFSSTTKSRPPPAPSTIPTIIVPEPSLTYPVDPRDIPLPPSPVPSACDLDLGDVTDDDLDDGHGDGSGNGSYSPKDDGNGDDKDEGSGSDTDDDSDDGADGGAYTAAPQSKTANASLAHPSTGGATTLLAAQDSLPTPLPTPAPPLDEDDDASTELPAPTLEVSATGALDLKSAGSPTSSVNSVINALLGAIDQPAAPPSPTSATLSPDNVANSAIVPDESTSQAAPVPEEAAATFAAALEWLNAGVEGSSEEPEGTVIAAADLPTASAAVGPSTQIFLPEWPTAQSGDQLDPLPALAPSDVAALELLARFYTEQGLAAAAQPVEPVIAPTETSLPEPSTDLLPPALIAQPTLVFEPTSVDEVAPITVPDIPIIDFFSPVHSDPQAQDRVDLPFVASPSPFSPDTVRADLPLVASPIPPSPGTGIPIDSVTADLLQDDIWDQSLNYGAWEDDYLAATGVNLADHVASTDNEVQLATANNVYQHVLVDQHVPADNIYQHVPTDNFYQHVPVDHVQHHVPVPVEEDVEMSIDSQDYAEVQKFMDLLQEEAGPFDPHQWAAQKLNLEAIANTAGDTSFGGDMSMSIDEPEASEVDSYALGMVPLDEAAFAAFNTNTAHATATADPVPYPSNVGFTDAERAAQNHAHLVPDVVNYQTKGKGKSDFSVVGYGSTSADNASSAIQCRDEQTPDIVNSHDYSPHYDQGSTPAPLSEEPDHETAAEGSNRHTRALPKRTFYAQPAPPDPVEVEDAAVQARIEADLYAGFEAMPDMAAVYQNQPSVSHLPEPAPFPPEVFVSAEEQALLQAALDTAPCPDDTLESEYESDEEISGTCDRKPTGSALVPPKPMPFPKAAPLAAPQSALPPWPSSGRLSPKSSWQNRVRLQSLPPPPEDDDAAEQQFEDYTGSNLNGDLHASSAQPHVYEEYEDHGATGPNDPCVNGEGSEQVADAGYYMSDSAHTLTGGMDVDSQPPSASVANFDHAGLLDHSESSSKQAATLSDATVEPQVDHNANYDSEAVTMAATPLSEAEVRSLTDLVDTALHGVTPEEIAQVDFHSAEFQAILWPVVPLEDEDQPTPPATELMTPYTNEDASRTPLPSTPTPPAASELKDDYFTPDQSGTKSPLFTPDTTPTQPGNSHLAPSPKRLADADEDHMLLQSPSKRHRAFRKLPSRPKQPDFTKMDLDDESQPSNVVGGSNTTTGLAGSVAVETPESEEPPHGKVGNMISLWEKSGASSATSGSTAPRSSNELAAAPIVVFQASQTPRAPSPQPLVHTLKFPGGDIHWTEPPADQGLPAKPPPATAHRGRAAQDLGVAPRVTSTTRSPPASAAARAARRSSVQDRTGPSPTLSSAPSTSLTARSRPSRAPAVPKEPKIFHNSMSSTNANAAALRARRALQAQTASVSRNPAPEKIPGKTTKPDYRIRREEPEEPAPGHASSSRARNVSAGSRPAPKKEDPPRWR